MLFLIFRKVKLNFNKYLNFIVFLSGKLSVSLLRWSGFFLSYLLLAFSFCILVTKTSWSAMLFMDFDKAMGVIVMVVCSIKFFSEMDVQAITYISSDET